MSNEPQNMKCFTCFEDVTAHTIFGKQLIPTMTKRPEELWHRYVGWDRKPSDKD